MNFKAKATKHRRCAYAACQNQADKIYADEHWRVIACSQAHADIARGEIDKVPPEHHDTVFREGKLPAGCAVPALPSEVSTGLEYL